MTLRTPRLILRPWRPEDAEPFAALNADPLVMEHFPSTLTRAESDAGIERIRGVLAKHGFCFWAVEAPGVAPFIGFCGLSVPGFTTSFSPFVEIGWRLAREHWGRGYATEAARAALRFGFEEKGLSEIVSFTVPRNVRSRAVMERLGMRHTGETFDHPNLPEGHPLQRHVLYRLTHERWHSLSDRG